MSRTTCDLVRVAADLGREAGVAEAPRASARFSHKVYGHEALDAVAARLGGQVLEQKGGEARPW